MVPPCRVALVSLLLLVGCASAPLPPAPGTIAADQRAAVYQKYKLNYQSNALTGSRWKRADGEYVFGQMEQVLATYPETQPGVSQIKTRNTVVGLIGGLGGAVLGYTFGRNMFAPAERRWSSGQQAAGYGVGGGLIITSFLIQALWSDPGPAMTDAYNQGLQRDYLGH